MDAAAVKRSLDESLANLNDRSLFRGLEDVVSTEVAGPNELAITLRDRSTFLLDDLFMPISKNLTSGTSAGSGPFVLKSSSSEQIVMSGFGDYYEGAPQVQEVVWKPYPALRTAWAAMMRGEVDFLYEVGQENVDFVQQESSVSTFSVLRPYVFSVVFNSRREQFKDSNVRQALNYGVDRSLIVERALRNRGVVAHTPVWPMHWAYDHSLAGYMYDPARASAILDSAGKKFPAPARNGASAVPARLRFTCLLPDNFPVWERMALLIQKQLSDIDVDMRLEAVPAEIFNERIGRGDFEAVFLEIVGGPSMSIPYVFWHSASSRNSFGYRSANVDSALESIRRATSDDAYRRAVAQLQQSMIADPPGIFLAWGQTARAVSHRFQVPNEPERSDVLLSLSRWRPVSATSGLIH